MALPRKISAVRKHITEALSDLYPHNESLSVATRLLGDRLGITQANQLAWPDELIDEASLEQLERDLTLLISGTPLQYVTGEAAFMGRSLRVNTSVLIPRPETEELVQWIAEDYTDHDQDLKILDIGTGSGCIAICLAQDIRKSRVTATDNSAAALEVARNNAALQNTEIDFIEHDILGADTIKGVFDVIVSNPPYVTEEDKTLMKKNVLEYEPHSALFAPARDPDVFYNAITSKAQQGMLKEGGALYFELNESRSSEIEVICRKSGLTDIEIRKDLSGKSRMMRCRR